MCPGHGIQAENFVLVACFADVRASASTIHCTIVVSYSPTFF